MKQGHITRSPHAAIGAARRRSADSATSGAVCVGPGSGGLPGLARAEAREAIALQVEGALKGLGELRVVHGHDAEPGLQLAHLDLGAGELEVDRVQRHLTEGIFPRTRVFLKWSLEKVASNRVRSRP